MRFVYYAEIWDDTENKPVSQRKALDVDVSGNPPQISIAENVTLTVTAENTILAAYLHIYLSKEGYAPVTRQFIGKLVDKQTVTVNHGGIVYEKD